MTENEEKVLISVRAAPARRLIASVILTALGALLVLVALDSAIAAPWRLIYFLLGAGAAYGSYRLFEATGDVLELTRSEFRSSSGRVLARVDNIAQVERGAFAFKPSNGFLVTLKTAEHPRAWAPGLWWRIGRRIGVGGVVAAGEAKAMAEVMTALITGVLPDDDDA